MTKTFTATASTSRPASKTWPPPGGICVSRVVRDQVRDKLDFAFEDLGEQQVKNIARPVRVYRVRDAVAKIPSAPGSPALPRRSDGRSRSLKCGRDCG